MHLTISRYWLPSSHTLSKIIEGRWVEVFLVIKFNECNWFCLVWVFSLWSFLFHFLIGQIVSPSYFCTIQGINVTKDSLILKAVVINSGRLAVPLMQRYDSLKPVVFQ